MFLALAQSIFASRKPASGGTPDATASAIVNGSIILPINGANNGRNTYGDVIGGITYELYCVTGSFPYWTYHYGIFDGKNLNLIFSIRSASLPIASVPLCPWLVTFTIVDVGSGTCTVTKGS